MARRSRARAAAAALVCISLLWSSALVGGGPVGAANTAAELLVDSSVPGSLVAAEGVRPFAGRDRYDTAVLLAERYALRRGGLGSVSAAIVVSGDSPADGLAAAGLAGRLSAPILLTPADSLTAGVARFLDRHDVATVIAVGGPDAISDAVLAQIGELEAEPQVQRVAGEDRFATAAEAASRLDGQSAWCGLDGTAALVVNGSDGHIAALAGLGTLAFARELPVVLTRANELPAASAQYLRRARIDRAVIVGDASAVPEAVISPILAQGVDEVIRVAADPFGSPDTAMARLLTDDCGDELSPSPSIVALAGQHAAIDAVAAAPLLAVGLDGSGPVPLLAGTSPLSLSVRVFLARTPEETEGRKNHLLVAAIGGRRAVDEATMDAAVSAAASGRALTATISAEAGDTQLRISFSERLPIDGARFIGRLRDELYVNDVPAWIDGQPEPDEAGTDGCENLSAVDVMLGNALDPGDVVELGPIDGWGSTEGDLRRIEGAALTVAEPPPPSGSPRVEIIALPGQTMLWVSVTADEYREPTAAGESSGITVNPRRIRVIAADGTPVAVRIPNPDPNPVGMYPFLGTALYSLELVGSGGADYTLAEHDRVVARSALAVNGAGQRSRGRGVTVTERTERFAVSAVRVGPPNPGVDDSARTARPDRIEGVSVPATASLGPRLSIVAKWSGDAAGAAGNAWQIFSTRRATARGTTDGEPPATQVWVDTSHRAITIHHIDAPAGEERDQTYGDLVQLLNSNRSFARHFAAELENPCAGGETRVDLDQHGLIDTFSFTGGISSVSFLVAFNDYVGIYNADGAAVEGAGNLSALVSDILGGLIPDYSQADDSVEVAAPVPGTEAVFRFTTMDSERTIGQQIDVRRKRINIREGIAVSYGQNDPATEVDETTSAAHRVFAVPSSDARLLSDLPQGSHTTP